MCNSFIIDKGIINKCLKDDGECVVYICTDKYWINGFEAQEVIDEIKAHEIDSSEINVKYLCEGSLGSYYLISY